MYLKYDEFEDMGGVANEDFYDRLEMKARRQIDRATFGRLTSLEAAAIPQSVKYCMYDLITAIGADETTGGIASGRSVTAMSNDGVSLSFGGGKSDAARYRGIIHAWLAGEVDACGTPLLYAGVCVS